MVTGKCLLELVALLAEIGAKVLELRVQVLACGGIYGEAVSMRLAVAWLLEQLAHLRQRLSSTSSVHADSWDR